MLFIYHISIFRLSYHKLEYDSFSRTLATDIEGKTV